MSQSAPLHISLTALETSAADDFDAAIADAVVRRLRGERMEREDSLFREIARALSFPPYFGYNWDALDECISDLDWLPASIPVVVSVRAPMQVLQLEPQKLPIFLNVLADGQRSIAGRVSSMLALPFGLNVVVHAGRDRDRVGALWANHGVHL